MIYRFSAMSTSGQAIEVQLQGPPGVSPDKMIPFVHTLSQHGLELESVQYIGSIDTDFQGLVVPVEEFDTSGGLSMSYQGIEVGSLRHIDSLAPALQGLVAPAEETDTPGGLSEKRHASTALGWYTPVGNAQANNVCVVEGCGRESSFHLCETHAIPGLVVDVDGTMFVISCWLVEYAGQMRVVILNDHTLGNLFGGREAFERQLREEGYKVYGLISGPEELETAKGRYPNLSGTPWIPAVGEQRGCLTREELVALRKKAVKKERTH